MKQNGAKMVQIFKSEKDVAKVVREIDDFVNSFTPDITGFISALEAEDEAIKEKFSSIAILWVRKLDWMGKHGWFDLRNQYSVETSQKIVRLLDLDPYPDYDRVDQRTLEDEAKFIELISLSHRTLQQSFSEIVFTWFTKMGTAISDARFQEIGKAITENMDYMFHKTPCI